MTRRPLLLSAVALLALPATSLAHDATVTCDLQRTGQYVVQADYLHLNPTWTFTDTTVTVTWADRYRKTLPLPLGCAPPPVVPPAPPVPEPSAPGTVVVPVVPVVGSVPAPPVVTPGHPEPMGRKRTSPQPLISTKTVRTLRSIACTRAGQRSASIVRIRVVWSRGGVVVKTKQRTFRKPGVVCRIPAAAG